MNLLYEHQIQKVARRTWRYRSKWLHSSLNGFYTMLYVQSCVYNGYRNFQFSYLDKTKLPGRQKTYPWNLITNTALSFKIANKNNLIIKHNYKKNKYISATKDNQYQHACYTRIKNGFKCKDISEKTELLHYTNQLYIPPSIPQSLNWLSMSYAYCWYSIDWHNYIIDPKGDIHKEALLNIINNISTKISPLHLKINL